MQNKNDKFSFQCPRCGKFRMNSDIYKNALSRHADIYICSQCGMDEAIRVFQNNILPFSEWKGLDSSFNELKKYEILNKVEKENE